MSNIKFCPLFSGSNGNSIFISYKSTRILIDCGCSFKRIKESLSCIDEDIFGLDAVLITHSHNDHTSALPMLLKYLNVPIVGSKGTLQELYPKISNYMSKLYANDTNRKFGLKDLSVESFSVPHDASDTVGYNIFSDNKSISLLTDIGHLSEGLYANVKGRDLVFLESNHDVHVLENCSYPHYLKQRILSNYGHLSNENAGIFAGHLVKDGAKKVILGHLSGEANTAELAYDTVAELLSANGIRVNSDMELSVSRRGELGKIVMIDD